MNLINGKTMYCPECGKELIKFDGRISPQNSELANVNAYCDKCDKHYHWIAFVSTKTGEHSVSGFSHYFPRGR